MQKPCSGSKDRSLPKEIKWKTVPYRLFFGRSYSSLWGAGGVAFLHPESNLGDKAYMCMYKITYVVNEILLLFSFKKHLMVDAAQISTFELLIPT